MATQTTHDGGVRDTGFTVGAIKRLEWILKVPFHGLSGELQSAVTPTNRTRG